MLQIHMCEGEGDILLFLTGRLALEQPHAALMCIHDARRRNRTMCCPPPCSSIFVLPKSASTTGQREIERACDMIHERVQRVPGATGDDQAGLGDEERGPV